VWLLVVSALVVGSTSVVGQQSPVAELLTKARGALDNLEYTRADSIARSVLALGSRASRAERLEALRLAAASLYPDEANAQRPDSAQFYLRQVVRLEPDRRLPSSISWPGLDSLIDVVRGSTFGAIARPRRENTITGVGSTVSIAAMATRSARFRLVAVAANGGPVIPLDSAGPTRDALLRFAVLPDSRPRLISGDYTLRFTAVDSVTADTIVVEYFSKVEAPPLSLVQVPAALDSVQLLPEWTRPHRARGVALGVGLGVATVLLANGLQGGDQVRSSGSIEPVAIVAGATMTLGTVWLALRDRGTRLPRNQEANEQLRARFDAAVRQAQAENARRRSSYTASMTIDPEPH
jgi:hypothetical protein